ncbi:hypothetical protein [Phormidium sp. CCY1219]|uniref:hypothetical protein n=1 Tax=Phormidium sp. CCY1219 TaxID=2886104 RepID=UPI002D1F9833|nr:hypothetical protein [Phormidium sp. CCY1219]MEB3827770.1 hypothetical protein [Phormidium sp. CCY1219]
MNRLELNFAWALYSADRLAKTSGDRFFPWVGKPSLCDRPYLVSISGFLQVFSPKKRSLFSPQPGQFLPTRQGLSGSFLSPLFHWRFGQGLRKFSPRFSGNFCPQSIGLRSCIAISETLSLAFPFLRLPDRFISPSVWSRLSGCFLAGAGE